MVVRSGQFRQIVRLHALNGTLVGLPSPPRVACVGRSMGAVSECCALGDERNVEESSAPSQASFWRDAKASIALGNWMLEKNGVCENLTDATECVLARCRTSRKRKLEETPPRDVSEARLSRLASLTDHLPLRDYDRFLHLVPRLVNVVTVRAGLRGGGGIRARTHTHSFCFARVCAAGRGDPGRWIGSQPAAQPDENRGQVLQRLLRSEALCGGPAGLRLSSLPCPRLPCAARRTPLPRPPHLEISPRRPAPTRAYPAVRARRHGPLGGNR